MEASASSQCGLAADHISYRLYALNENGRIARAWGIEAPGDRDAIVEALSLDVGVDAELWKQGRRLTLIPA